MSPTFLMIAAPLVLAAFISLSYRDRTKADVKLAQSFKTATHAADDCGHDLGTREHDLIVSDHLARHHTTKELEFLYNRADAKKRTNATHRSRSSSLEERRRALRDENTHHWQMSRLEQAMDLKIGR